jgi:hypothetical protein
MSRNLSLRVFQVGYGRTEQGARTLHGGNPAPQFGRVNMPGFLGSRNRKGARHGR